MKSRTVTTFPAFALLLLWAVSVSSAEAGVVGRDPVAVSTARSQQEAKKALEKGFPGAGVRALLVSPHDYLGTLLLPPRGPAVTCRCARAYPLPRGDG